MDAGRSRLAAEGALPSISRPLIALCLEGAQYQALSSGSKIGS